MRKDIEIVIEEKQDADFELSNSTTVTNTNITNEDDTLTIRTHLGTFIIDTHVIQRFATVEDFPEVGKANVLYVDLEYEMMYYWDNNKYVVCGKKYDEIIEEHKKDTNNPHQVTAEQVGSYKITETDKLLEDKVDKVDGKSLVADEEIKKLEGIEPNANNYVLPEDVVRDSEYIHTDNNFTNDEKNKLKGVETNANHYILPNDVVRDSKYVHTDYNFTNFYKSSVEQNSYASHIHDNREILDETTASYTTAEKSKLANIEPSANYYVLPSNVVKDSKYVHTDNNFTDEDKEKINLLENNINANAERITTLEEMDVITDVTSLGGTSEFIWNTITGKHSDKLFINYALSKEEVISIIGKLEYVDPDQQGDMGIYALYWDFATNSSINILIQNIDGDISYTIMISGIYNDSPYSETLWDSENGWRTDNTEPAEVTELLTGLAPMPIPEEMKAMGLTERYVGGQNDRLVLLFYTTGADYNTKQFYRTLDGELHHHYEGKWHTLIDEKRLESKVDKVDGYGLSQNDFDNQYKSKLDNIEDNAQVNRIEHIAINGKLLPVENKIVNIELLDDLATEQYVNDYVSSALKGVAYKTDLPSIEGLATEDFVNKGLENKLDKTDFKLEPVIINGSFDFKTGTSYLTFTKEICEMILQNKTAPIQIQDKIYNVSGYFDQSTENSIYINYNRIDIPTNREYMIGIGIDVVNQSMWVSEHNVFEINSGSSGSTTLTIMTHNDTSSYDITAEIIEEYGSEALTMIIILKNSNCYYKLDINEMMARKGIPETVANDVVWLVLKTNSGVRNTKAFIYTSNTTYFSNQAHLVRIENPDGMIICDTIIRINSWDYVSDDYCLSIDGMDNFVEGDSYISLYVDEHSQQWGNNVCQYTYYIHYDEIGLCHFSVNQKDKEI